VAIQASGGVERNYSGSRVSFQRLSDARILRGWVDSFEGPTLVVRTSADFELAVGDGFSFRVNGLNSDAVFLAELSALDDNFAALRGLIDSGDLAGLGLDEQVLSFSITSGIALLPPAQDARFNTATGSVLLGEGIDCVIQDISLSGIGVICHEHIEPGLVLPARIICECGTIDCEVEVRYCRKLADGQNTFRMGLLLQPMDRVSAGRWQTMFRKA
jgi:hypothetical protein